MTRSGIIRKLKRLEDKKASSGLKAEDKDSATRRVQIWAVIIGTLLAIVIAGLVDREWAYSASLVTPFAILFITSLGYEVRDQTRSEAHNASDEQEKVCS